MGMLAFFQQTNSLIHSKTVLFINDHHAQFFELYRIFNQGMGAE